MLDQQYEFRDEITEALRKDLVGPKHGEEEVIHDAPIQAYICGVLFPQTRAGALDGDERDIDLTPVKTDSEEGATALGDPAVALSNVKFPSSMGLTFTVDQGVDAIAVEVRVARYEETPAEDEEIQADERWQRVVVKMLPTIIDLGSNSSEHDVADKLKLVVRVRKGNSFGQRAVTCALVNEHLVRPEGERRDAKSFFQPEMIVTAAVEGLSPFVARRDDFSGDDPELKSNELLYREVRMFAVGHGCSSAWDSDPDDSSRAKCVRTEVVPVTDLEIVESNPDIDLPILEMRRIVEDPADETLRGLAQLCDGYDEWVTRQGVAADALPEAFRQTAQEHIAGCTVALRRMRRGVELLASRAESPEVWEAFRLASQAMLRQRARSVWLGDGRRLGDSDGPDEHGDHRWRPFQIGFMLIAIEGIIDPKSDDRNIADLLWFPTGGGKTEAYLGLIAFTIFLRRLRRPTEGGGVSALMRYTLRLLTIQQFQRATLLICACESIRRERANDLGSIEISVGLWVGMAATPNSLRDAKRALDKYSEGSEPAEGKGNPVQLEACPWCGEPLDHKNYRISEGSDRRLEVSCWGSDCEFRRRLPIYLVDEDIYKYRPTLLIATVDKFASLPWNTSVGHLFGRKDGVRDGAPPDLIVQDELHLISGPLGTLTGLYETVVDVLSTEDGVRPKVIASTATIRRADRQGLALFDRRVNQFPPPGLTANSFYFAKTAKASRRGTRRFVGVMAPGTSQATMLVRTYSALLQAAAVEDVPDAVKDPYWTLVGYFNSLRVLGGARLQVQDDVPDRLDFLAKDLRAPRDIENRIELTSRVPNTSIPQYLEDMALSLPDEAVDVILATNMISVGVDIDRLGLMAVMGQPQASAEYIQATSRVGRQHPGLVVTLLNAAKSRDRSHYEAFQSFHSAMYREVEASSVTPFAPRARDRGLAAVIVALARHTVPELSPNPAASEITRYRDRLDPIKKVLVDRVSRILNHDTSIVSDHFDRVVAEWVRRADTNPVLVYQNRSDPENALLVDAARFVGNDDSDVELDAFPTLWSLRDVDAACGLYQVR